MLRKTQQLHENESGISLPELIITSILTAGIALLIFTIFLTFFRTSDSVTVGALDSSRGQVLSTSFTTALRNADQVKVTPINSTTKQQLIQVRSAYTTTSGTQDWQCEAWVFGVTTTDGQRQNSVMHKTGKDKVTAIPSSWTGWGKIADNIVLAPDKTTFVAAYSGTGPVAITYSLSNRRIADSVFNNRTTPQAKGSSTLACW